jgi:hypothetical protein
LREITQTQKGKPVSRAQLPRLLNKLDWSALNKLIERSFGVRIQYHQSRKWIAIDGKALSGAARWMPITLIRLLPLKFIRPVVFI